ADALSHAPQYVMPFSSSLRCTSRSTLFPYTTLFRSLLAHFEDQVLVVQKNGAEAYIKVSQNRHNLLGIIHMTGVVMLATVRARRSEEHTSELQSRENLVCRLLLEKKKKHHRNFNYST